MIIRQYGLEPIINSESLLHLEGNQAELAEVLAIKDGLTKDFDPAKTPEARASYNRVMQGEPLEGPLSKEAAAVPLAMSHYQKSYPADTASMLENVGAKLILWIRQYRNELYDPSGVIKARQILFYGQVKKHEACFLHVLWLAGHRVFCIDKNKDPLEGLPNYQALTQLQINSGGPVAQRTNAPPLQETTRQSVHSNAHASSQNHVEVQQRSTVASEPKEMSYEELAGLSESVVMIRVYDGEGTVMKGGSGVVVSRSGYILTNFHVVTGGTRFGIVFENDPKEYESHQIIKYHQDFDVAVIRVERQVQSLPLSHIETVRGQKVVAIGSPLGLFNTISDGIVSGHRHFEDVDMIQFTAPISSGSSGGALLNMRGELLGITTAGFDGQNLNLAVPSSYLKFFAGNFIGS